MFWVGSHMLLLAPKISLLTVKQSNGSDYDDGDASQRAAYSCG
jgi:hypothetical protein